MSRRIRLFASLGLLALGLAIVGCVSNPMLGTWQVDPEKSDPLAAAGQSAMSLFKGSGDIEFQPGKVVQGSESETVRYDLQGDRVVVTTPDGKGRVFDVVDEDHVSTKMLTGTLVLKRVAP